MTNRKGIADRLDAIADCGWARGDEKSLREAAAALRQEPSVEQIARTIAGIEGNHEGEWTEYLDSAQAIASLYRDKP